MQRMSVRPVAGARVAGLVGVCLYLCVLAGLLSCPSALAGAQCSGSACEAWWHVGSQARPTHLVPGGVGVDEVQQIVATPGELFPGVSGAGFVIKIGGHDLKEFATEQIAVFGGLEEPTPENVQETLEGPYGAGGVLVSAIPGMPAGTVALEVKTLNTAPVAPVEVEQFVGTAEASVVRAASFTGSQIVATVSNLGDVSAHGEECAQVAAGAGKYTNDECNELAEPGAGEFEKEPVTIVDRLPAGLRAVGIEATAEPGLDGEVRCSTATVSCTFEGEFKPYRQVEVRVDVIVEGAAGGEPNEVSVSGGGVAGASARREIEVGGPTSFGIEHYELTNEEPGGGPDEQAGSHPFQTTFSVSVNQSVGEFNKGLGKAEAEPAEQAKDLRFRLPPGLIGNPTPFKRCSLAEFFHKPSPTCSAQTVLGVAVITFDEPGTLGIEKATVPVFNLEPQVGEPARFGFLVTSESPVFIGSAVRSGQDYAIEGVVDGITQTAALISSEVTFWGVPGSPAHDGQRGEACLNGEEGCLAIGESGSPPFFELPTSCTGEQESSVVGDSWLDPIASDALPVLATTKLPGLDGCERLPFRPSIVVEPDGGAASSSTGLTVDVHNPQQESLNAEGIGEADPKDITVTLPEGVAVNPSGGEGLEGCSEGLVGFTGFAQFEGQQTATFTPRLPGSPTAIEAGEGEPLRPGVNFCSNAAKIGTAEIRTPLLANPIKGAVYLASQNENPFGSLIAMYIVAEDPVSGVLIKLVGEVQLDPSTGQITSTFKNSPQAPFEDAVLEFFGGDRAPLASPARCGSYTTSASFVPWSAESGQPASQASSTFQITSGPNGGACPGASLPFSPTLTGGMVNINAGGFGALTTTIGREDGNQDLQSVRIQMPAGLEGMLSNVRLCPEAQANEGTCSPESRIGETTVSAGIGPDPVTVKGGSVYITEKYEGAPFGLSIVNPVKAGPFDLEHDTSNPAQQPACDCIVVRAKIEVNPYTAELTVTTDQSGPHAIPHIIDGIPVQIRKVNVLVNRPNFTFDPTNCDPMAIDADIEGDEGASSLLSVPFQATNCTVLKFTPTIRVSTGAHPSKQDGASLVFKISYPKNAVGSQSWFEAAKFDIPKQLPARLTTLQKACLASVFEANPAACPPASMIGQATVHTPVLPEPLTGPVYFVSYGGARFPDAVIVLHGYGITIDLRGETFIKKGVTSATFRRTPDVPFETIEVKIPTGPHSEFAANLPAKAKNDMCGQKLRMPTAFKAQNGTEIHESTPIAVTGCAKPRKRKHKAARHPHRGTRKRPSHKQ